MKERLTASRTMSGGFATGAPASKILIVDDEPFVREILSRWLDSEGYNCHVAANAEQAWQPLQRGDFSLLVTDIRMPGKSGIELLAMAKEQFPDLAVIMVTAVDDRNTAIRTLELGAYGYVTKPLEKNEVIINVVNALERRRLALESRQYELRLREKVREQTEDIRASREEIVLRLMAAQEYRHDETGGHIHRMGLYCEAVAKKMGHPQEYTEMLRLTAPMHDVGKIAISDLILMKPGKLTDAEFEIMKTHTITGAHILEGTTLPILNLARDIALYHHEKWDGSGYPEGLAELDIPEASRIVAVVDVYDALVHERVYRPAMPGKDALAIIVDGRGKHFDPRILDTFLETLPDLRRIREEISE